MLGMEKMKKYVSCFAYGNQDLSGNPGKNDGIRKSWLCSSLRISPLEQIEFLKKILQKILPVSDHAYEQTSKLLYVSDLAHNWKLYGKRGGGIWDGTGRSIGWFVGWVTKEQKTLVFACLVRSNSRDFLVNSLYAKEKVLNIFDKAL
jgi:beta-lactamase class D